MQTVGLIAIVVVAIVIVLGLFVAVISLPDVRRYVRIRHM
jgi:hypothetical protein